MWIFCILLSLFFSASVSAISDAETKEEFLKLVMSCATDHPVEKSDLMKLRSLELPNNRESKCLLACAYRKIGIMDSEGKYDKEMAYKFVEIAKSGDVEGTKNAKKLADICNKVNDEKVSDGNEGCDRAGLMFLCTIENAPKLGFTV